MGMAGAAATASVFGTAALPFVVCATAGFAWGAASFYRDALRKAAVSLERYPRLLQLHLDANFPARRFDRWPAESLRPAAFERSWEGRSMLVVAWLTAQPALDVRFPFFPLMCVAERVVGVCVG